MMDGVYPFPSGYPVHDIFFGNGLDKGTIIDRLHMVQAWIHIHREELEADWRIALSGEKVFRIDPLK